MKRKIPMAVIIIGFGIINAEAQDITELDDVTVTARRPMTEIGIQKTPLDSTALKQNIALSLADILTTNSSIFVKSSGRASLSTIAFRGTSPSHTTVVWNGLPVNSPMLGMTDFSTIPAYLIDSASLLHGSSSLSQEGGGLGGAISLSSTPDSRKGLHAQYVQGIGSYKTFDEFLRLSYGNTRWHFSTRALYSSSANDYSYINRDKKLNIYDEDHQIIGQYHPKEKNRLGAFRDLHILQEIYRHIGSHDRIGLNVWNSVSNREIPMLSTDYSNAAGIENRQRENTLRAVADWRHGAPLYNLTVRAGYIHTWMAYDYARETQTGLWSQLTRSRSKTDTFSESADFNWWPLDRWLFSVSLKAIHNHVSSTDHNGTPATPPTGYSRGRMELSGTITARWQPADGVGLSALIREESHGRKVSAPIPAIFADWRCYYSRIAKTDMELTVKASGSRNYRVPTLNDLYFMPGGNPDLKSERGVQYDCGLELKSKCEGVFDAAFAATWFDSHISNWIIWLPTFKGFFSPANVKSVHAYGIELKADASLTAGNGWKFNFGASYSWTPSINEGEPLSTADGSMGKQLPYVPKHSASATASADWHGWGVRYDWHTYSERFTQTSNASTLTGSLPAYSVSNLSFEKNMDIRSIMLQLKLAVSNLFDQEYLSVLSRPMPGTSLEFFVSLSY